MKIKKTKGYTLVEILIVTGLISFITVSGYAIFNKARDISMANDESKIIEYFRGEITRMYENSPSYEGLDNVAVNQAKVTPSNMIGTNSSQIFNKFGGAVNITPINYLGIPNSGFRITYPNIRISSCPYIVLSLIGSFNSMSVNGTTVKNYGDDAVDPAILTNACSNTTDAIGASINFEYVSSFLITSASTVPGRAPRAGTIFSIPKDTNQFVCDVFNNSGQQVSSSVPASIRSQMIFTFKSIDNFAGRCPTTALYNTWVNNLITAAAANPTLTYQEVYSTIVEPQLLNDGTYSHSKSTEVAIADAACIAASGRVENYDGPTIPSSYIEGSGNKCRVN